MTIDLLSPDVIFLVIFPIVSSILAVLLKPSKTEAKLVARALSFLIVGVIKFLQKRYKEHPHYLEDQFKKVVHKISEKIHHKDGEVVVG